MFFGVVVALAAFATYTRTIMTAEKTTMAFGWRVYGLGVMALGMVCLAWGDFDLGQPVPKDFPDRTALAYAAAAFMFVAGAAVEWRRSAAWAAAALAAYYALIVVILMNGRLLLAHYAVYGTYSGIAEQLAIAAGGLIVYATNAEANAKIDVTLAARLIRLRVLFGFSAGVGDLLRPLDLVLAQRLVLHHHPREHRHQRPREHVAREQRRARHRAVRRAAPRRSRCDGRRRRVSR